MSFHITVGSHLGHYFILAATVTKVRTRTGGKWINHQWGDPVDIADIQSAHESDLNVIFR